MNYKIVLDSYEGPLDLLLNLINKAEVDIYDIPINLITEQYMDYIYAMEQLDLEVASDFILMAATLLEIKSRMLLPDSTEEEDEEIDPREELVHRLLEYKKYKDAANKLRIYEKQEIKAYYKPKEDLSEFEEELELEKIDLDVMLKSINNIIKNRKISKDEIEIEEIKKSKYSVKECSANIINELNNKNKIKFTSILSENATRNEVVTYFLALLELIKLRLIKVLQVKDFSDLIIKKIE